MSFFNTLKIGFTYATDSTLRFAKAESQYVVLCDACFHGSGFGLMVENYLVDQEGKTKKNTLEYPLVRNFLQQRN